MYILLTALHIFLIVLVKRIYLLNIYFILMTCKFDQIEMINDCIVRSSKLSTCHYSDLKG